MPWWGWSWSWNKTGMIYGFKFFLNLKGTAPCRPWTSSFESLKTKSADFSTCHHRKSARQWNHCPRPLGQGEAWPEGRQSTVKPIGQPPPLDDHRGKNQGKGDRMESFQEPCWVEKNPEVKKMFKKNKRIKLGMDMFFGQRSRKPLEIER